MCYYAPSNLRMCLELNFYVLLFLFTGKWNAIDDTCNV